MKIVIQCAASKDQKAGEMRTADDKPVVFVAHPKSAPERNDVAYAHPDDKAEDGRRWRDHLLEYNREPGSNLFGLLQAWRLYQNPAYGALIEHYGKDNVYILSAGWGLIRADFLTPVYNITFSAQADTFARRKKHDAYSDINMLEKRADEPVIFFGGIDYLPLFCSLTEGYAGRRIAAFNSTLEPRAPGVQLVRYQTRMRTNWHYEAVRALVNGTFSPA